MANASKTVTKSGSLYRIIPCFHGVCASPSEEVTMALRRTLSTKGAPGAVVLPGGIEYDIYIPNESIAFPKEILLSVDDLRNLSCSNPNNFSFTHYGPPPPMQDKPTNQDFALSGCFEDDKLQPYRFSVVADGISNGYSFPQRGAQLSCFAAYECLKELYRDLSKSGRTLSEGDVDHFRQNLATKINEYLQLDRIHLLNVFEIEHSGPMSISSKVWRDNFRDKPEKWYGNTLLVSFLSPFGGFVVYAGDGGIILIKGGGVVKEVIRSDSSSVIKQFVTNGVSSGSFYGAFVECAEADGFVEFVTVTDGLDRTYQLNNVDLSSFFSKDARLEHLIDQIRNLDSRFGQVDVDNFSIARIFLQLSTEPHTRLTGSGGAIVPVSLNRNEEVQRVGTTASEDSSVESGGKKKAVRALKLPLTTIFLGISICLGLINALVLGLAPLNNSGATSASMFRPEMAATDAAARAAAMSALELVMLQDAILILTEVANVAMSRAEAARVELATAEGDVASTEERVTELTEVANVAMSRAEAARVELATADNAFLMARNAAERMATLAAETAATAINQMVNQRP
jgi:hypothetical protein